MFISEKIFHRIIFTSVHSNTIFAYLFQIIFRLIQIFFIYFSKMHFFNILKIISKETWIFTLSLKSYISWHCWIWIVQLIKKFWKTVSNRYRQQIFNQKILLLLFFMRQINYVFNIPEIGWFNWTFNFINWCCFHIFWHFFVFNYWWIIGRFH